MRQRLTAARLCVQYPAMPEERKPLRQRVAERKAQEAQAHKPLRQRIADREAGIASDADDPKAASRRKLRGRVILAAYLLMAVSLALLLLEVIPIISTGNVANVNWTGIILYSVLFVAGRAAIVGIKVMRWMS